jgi:septal ring factor EnvC (AmiA/AmiB activator)
VSRLRVEEHATAVTIEPAVPVVAPKQPPDLDHWRKLALQSTERLNYAETQLKDLRVAADDARARFSKYKDRLDKANERTNDLQIELVRMTAERDDLRRQIASQEAVARKVHEFRQSILNGPLWELFVELAVVSPPATAGGETHDATPAI